MRKALTPKRSRHQYMVPMGAGDRKEASAEKAGRRLVRRKEAGAEEAGRRLVRRKREGGWCGGSWMQEEAGGGSGRQALPVACACAPAVVKSAPLASAAPAPPVIQYVHELVSEPP